MGAALVADRRLDPAALHPMVTLTGWRLQDPYRMALLRPR